MLFKSEDLKGKQEELKKMAYTDHLEELGRVAVNDLDIDVVEELQEVLESLNYKTEYRNDYLIFLNSEEKRECRINEYIRSLNKNKSGSGSMMYRISLPIDLVRELNLEDDKEVKIYEEDNKIIIEKLEEENKMLKLNLLEEGQRELLKKGTLNEIVGYLNDNYDDLFSWIEDEEKQQPIELSKTELPDFKEIEDLQDLERELEKVDFDWWGLEIE